MNKRLFFIKIPAFFVAVFVFLILGLEKVGAQTSTDLFLGGRMLVANGCSQLTSSTYRAFWYGGCLNNSCSTITPAVCYDGVNGTRFTISWKTQGETAWHTTQSNGVANVPGYAFGTDIPRFTTTGKNVVFRVDLNGIENRSTFNFFAMDRRTAQGVGYGYQVGDLYSDEQLTRRIGGDLFELHPQSRMFYFRVTNWPIGDMCGTSRCTYSHVWLYDQRWCGDGLVHSPNSYNVAEQCDDGNNVNGDGCNAVCRVEPAIPDCTNLTADKNLNNLSVGDTVNFSITAGGTAPVTSVAAWVYRTPNSCLDSERLYVQYPFPSASGPGTYAAGTWTPTANQTGPFEVFASVWNDGITECKSSCVDGEPRYLCPSTAADPSVCKLSGVVSTPTPTFTPTPAENCASVKVNLIKDTPWGNPRQCNGAVDMSCNTDRVTSQTYSYVVDYRDSSGNIQTALRQTGRVTSFNGDLCSNPQNLGYSPEIRLSNMPSGGSARVTLSYLLNPTLMRVLATTNPNTSSSTDDVIVVDNIRAGQSMNVRGHLCVLGICGPSCSTFPQSQPEVVVSTSTTPCN